MSSVAIPGCVFCAIVRHQAPASIVHEDSVIVAFMDIKPINSGHFLVVPKLHKELIADLPAKTVARMFASAATLSSAVRKCGVKCEGVNLFLADGAAAGQEVPHVHMHVIPRFQDDGFGHHFPPHYGVRPARGDLDRTAAMIRGAMSK